MELVIKLDDSLGKLRNNECERMSLSATIINYSDALEQLPFENCPEGFKKAFKNHENAWRNMISITNKHGQLRGEMHHLFDRIEISDDSVAFKKSLKAIWDTWSAIESEMKSVSAEDHY